MKKTLNSFYLPVKFRSGEGAVRECAGEIAPLGSRCFVLTGGNSAKACGALDDLLSTLEALGIACRVFGGIENNPTVASCIDAGREAARCGADCVAGLGGGSVLDAAKAAAVIAACPEGGEEYLYSKNWPAALLPILLVGTTAGTGSEVTAVSVLTDSSGRKKSVTDPRIFASLAIGDPRYTATMPRRLTLTTAVDALSHCVESYFSKKGSAISRALALSGIKLIMPPLKRIAEGGEPDAADREALYDGSIFGGMAISVTGTCFPHNVGYYLTEKNGVPHGFACAFFLPEFISHSSEAEPGLAA
ncbi:MAG: iron-containing alcohol dehydrogenase, partial [Clostridia bacterium]|nr:iron-containing alcohol dehydrogenase [Clostridia bacterium]